MLRALLLAFLFVATSGCHTVPDPYDPARQKRMDDCLKQCGGANPEPDKTAYPPAPSEQADTRTPCERRCYSIP